MMLQEPATLWGAGESSAGVATLQRDSEPETDQCLGALITHADDWLECTEPDCDDLHSARHPWVVSCLNQWATCPCRPGDGAS